MLGHKPGFKHYFQVVVTYAILIAAVVGGTYFVVQLAQGYQLNLASQQLELTGLLRLESNPDADVIIDGKHTGDQTPARLSLVEGERQINLEQVGYQSWSRTVKVRGGSVSSITYPFLIPYDVESGTTIALDLEDADSYAFDQSNSLIAVATSRQVIIYQLLNATFEPYRQINLPTNNSVDQLIWAESSEQLLISQTGRDGPVTWSIADISEPQTELTDITNEVGRLSPQGFVVDTEQKVLLGGNDELWLLDVQDKSMKLLTRRADSFAFNNSAVVWHDPTESESLHVWSQGQGELIPVLRDITTKPQLSLSSYSNQTNIAYTHSGSTYIIVDALRAPFERELDQFADVVDISPGGRFVLGQIGDKQYLVHDIEENVTHSFELVDRLSTINWTGTHHFIGRGKSGVYVIDYEGSNQRRINFQTANSAVLNAQKTAVFSVVDQQLLVTPLR